MNNLGVVNTGKLISQQALQLLLVQFPALRRMANNYGSEAVKFGQTVVVKKRGVFEARDYDRTKGYAADAQDINMQDILVPMNKHKHVTVGLDDVERSSTDIDIINLHAAPVAHAIGKAVFDDVFAKVVVGEAPVVNEDGTVTPATGFPFETVIANAAYDRGAAAKVAQALNDRNIPDFDRYCILNNAGAASLQQDFQVVANFNPTSALVTEDTLPRVSGLDHSRFGGVPDNDIHLFGIAGHADGIGVATRLPAEPPTDLPKTGIIETVSGPAGLSLMLRRWYNMDMGKEFYANVIMYGTEFGEVKALQRLVTVANNG